MPLAAREIKFKLDAYNAARVTFAIVAYYALGQVSKGTDPQLVFANAIALIFIITIIYSNRLMPLAKKRTPQVWE